MSHKKESEISNDAFDKNQKKLYEKFSKGHWLSYEDHVRQFFIVNTYYRRNIHRFAIDYLGLRLHPFQIIILYLMGISNFICIIASRAASKSFLIAIYSCCRAILYPGSPIVLTSGTRGQSKLIVSKKIQEELMGSSPNLRREILKIVSSQVEVEVFFRNGSTISTVTCNENARGHRAVVVVGEEAREIDHHIWETVISPFLYVRQVPFALLKDYQDNPQFKEEPSEIYISSSIEASHWLYKTAKLSRDGMFKNNGAFFIALDYSITLKHGIRTRKQLIREFSQSDPITIALEYKNFVLRSNTKAYFTYDIVKNCQTLKMPFYPRRNEDVVRKVKNKYTLQKQTGEIRVVACDIAAIDRTANDNSVFTCLRLFPEIINDGVNNAQSEFRVQVPYLEGMRGSEIRRQAIRIRQLFEDFEADYIVLDLRNIGVSIYDCLARVLYDDERNVEYAPLQIMNDDEIAQRIRNPNADRIIYGVAANAKLNSEMAVGLRSAFINRNIELLIPKDEGFEEISKHVPEYNSLNDPEERLWYERPYIETMLLINELINLEYEKLENTGLIRIREQSGMMKDRYSSLGMGNLFVSQLARDLLASDDDINIQQAPLCVSAIPF